jgi:effector-binding domain-containing protein
LANSGSVCEAYVTDPGSQPDPNKYETKLFLPIEAEGTANAK